MQRLQLMIVCVLLIAADSHASQSFDTLSILRLPVTGDRASYDLDATVAALTLRQGRFSLTLEATNPLQTNLYDLAEETLVGSHVALAYSLTEIEFDDERMLSASIEFRW